MKTNFEHSKPVMPAIKGAYSPAIADKMSDFAKAQAIATKAKKSVYTGAIALLIAGVSAADVNAISAANTDDGKPTTAPYCSAFAVLANKDMQPFMVNTDGKRSTMTNRQLNCTAALLKIIDGKKASLTGQSAKCIADCKENIDRVLGAQDWPTDEKSETTASGEGETGEGESEGETAPTASGEQVQPAQAVRFNPELLAMLADAMPESGEIGFETIRAVLAAHDATIEAQTKPETVEA